MKKNLYRSAFCALGAAALLTGFTACSDDNVDSPSYSFDVDTKTQTEGITSEIDGAVATFDIASNSDWKVSVPAEAADWLDVSDTIGTGNKTITVYVEPNFGSATGRSAKIRCYSNSSNAEKYIEVKQVPTFNGEAVANDDKTLNKVMLASTGGLGLGYSLKGEILQTTSVNFKGALKTLSDMGGYDYLYNYKKLPVLESSGATLDSVETKTDTLGVSLNFDISYAAFKFHIGGKYHGKEDKKNETKAYSYACKYNTATAALDMPNIVDLYNEGKDVEAKDADAEDKAKQKLLAPALRTLIKKIEKPEDDEDFEYNVEKLVNNYGIGIISEVQLGAMLDLSMKFNRDSIAQVMGVDSAKIETSLKLGLFQTKVGVDVAYESDAKTIFENSAYNCRISGGKNEQVLALDNLLSTDKTYPNLFKDVHSKIDEWKKSIDANDVETLAVTHVGICKIWELFSSKTAKKVKNFIETKYKAEMDKLFPKGVESKDADKGSDDGKEDK